MPVGSTFTSTITRDQLITDAYLTIGVLADGETLPSSLQTTAIRRLNAIIRELVQTMQKDPALVEPALSLFSATRHLERIADHATNIAEDVIYLVEGEIVRHRPDAARGEDES